ncbi:MAG: M23 family metallopeptidase, partial [Candidatus Obscuribacterales bacterium]|nr:M23 family metallopeptidase [Candidatus Obscuribacterales bacterium]
EFMHFTQLDRRYDWDTSWAFHVNIGAASKRRTEDYAYRLPYSSDEHYYINQSYGGTFSHFVGSDSEYAIDFGLPEGTKVLAARAGTVIAYRSDSDVGGNSSAFENHENYIVIKHDDGTYANYSHFKKDGVLVSLGQFVTEGTPIGLSGATGFASQPHLHFVVYRVIDGDKRPSLPFTTRTPNGLVKQLEKDQMY